MEIPREIQNILGEKHGNPIHIGLSGAVVYVFDDMVLKIQANNSESQREYNMMHWLANKLPVPEIIKYAHSNKLSYLLMCKCSGKMACDTEYMQQPKHQAELLANALNMIWTTDCKACPYDSTIDIKLQQAEYNVVNRLVNIQDCDPEIFTDEGFKDLEALLYWLQSNRPEEDLVISHGDFCLPNVFFENNKLSGLIDLGRAGIADKWFDIALCHRSTKDNYSGKYGHKWPGYSTDYLFDALGFKPDWERIRYYILLDALS